MMLSVICNPDVGRTWWIQPFVAAVDIGFFIKIQDLRWKSYNYDINMGKIEGRVQIKC